MHWDVSVLNICIIQVCWDAKNLVKSVTVENSMDPDDVVTYTFNYRMNAGNVVMCSYGTAVNPVIVTYGY